MRKFLKLIFIAAFAGILLPAFSLVVYAKAELQIISNSIFEDFSLFGLSVRQKTIFIITLIFLIIIIIVLIHIIYSRGQINKKVQTLLNTDSLTGLNSRNSFLKKGMALLEKSNDSGYTLLYIDINNFKYLNDIYGYTIGDEIILEMSRRLKDELSADEIISRVSADRFIALIKHRNTDELESRLERLINNLGTFSKEDFHCRYVVSMGVFVIEKGSNDMFAAMDSANYARCEAKGNHKSTFIFYDDRIRNCIKAEKEIEAEMENALKEGQFVPYFQPKVDMKTGKIIGSEALVRWIHPHKGIISPAGFIPTFEKNGFINEIDTYIFEKACKNTKNRMRNGKKTLPVSCNFSRRHLLSPGLSKTLLKIANKYEIPTSLLELEITESIAMERTDEIVECVHQLKSMGFKIAIDDFGTGYSSLGMLKKLPADILKLDKSFLDDCLVDKVSFSIIKSIAEIAEAFGMQVVCEGVETKEQAELLQKAGCAIAQGFYYYKPLPWLDFEALMD